MEDNQEYFDPNILVGKTREEADSLLSDMGAHIRITFVNGKPCLCTRDYRMDRINVKIVDEKISEVVGVG